MTQEAETAEEIVFFLTEAGHHGFSAEDITMAVEAIIPLLTRASVLEGIELLKDAGYREYYENFIREKALTLKELSEDYKKALENPENENKIMMALSRLDSEATEPGSVQRTQDLRRGFDKDYIFSSQDREKIINKMLLLAQNEHELYSWPLFPAELEKAIEKFKSLQCRNSLKKK